MMLAASSAYNSSRNGRLRGAWWCDKCIALLSAPDIGIGNLFALLRQWTPSTQLQLDTIVIEVSHGREHHNIGIFGCKAKSDFAFLSLNPLICTVI